MLDKEQNKKKYKNLLGLEIAENCIVGVEINFVKNNINIVNAFRIDVPVFQDLNQTIALVKQTLKISNIKAKEFSIGLSMQYFKLFPVAIPSSIPEYEIDQIILQEGNVDPNKDIVSWMPLKNTQRQEADGIKRCDVLGVSTSKQFVEFVNLLAKQCNLKPIAFIPSFLGLGFYLEKEVNNKLEATLWISQIRSELVVWSGREPIYEHLFLSHGLNDQVFQSVNYIQTQLAGSQVLKIFVCGPFSKETNLSTIPYNIESFSLPRNIVDIKGNLNKVSINEAITSLGLAVIGSNNFDYNYVNLLKPFKEASSTFKKVFKQPASSKELKLPFSFGKKSFDGQLSRYVYLSIILVLLSLMLNAFIHSSLLSNVNLSSSFYENKLLLAQTHLAKFLNEENTHKILKLKADYFSDLIEYRKPWSKILHEIADMTPKGLWIDRLEIANNKIDIFGRALSVDSVANFSINLNYTAKLLTNAQIIALKKFQEEGFDIVEFQLSTYLKSFPLTLTNQDKKNISNSAPNT